MPNIFFKSVIALIWTPDAFAENNSLLFIRIVASVSLLNRDKMETLATMMLVRHLYYYYYSLIVNSVRNLWEQPSQPAQRN